MEDLTFLRNEIQFKNSPLLTQMIWRVFLYMTKWTAHFSVFRYTLYNESWSKHEVRAWLFSGDY